MQGRFENFTVLINTISRSIRKIKIQEMAAYGLRSAHVSCLYYLYTDEGLTATELCEKCAEDKATISRSLDFLEREGYLLCECKSTRRYKSPLILTEKGVEVGRIITEKVDRVLAEISAELTEDERVAFYRSLTLISRGLADISKKSET